MSSSLAAILSLSSSAIGHMSVLRRRFMCIWLMLFLRLFSSSCCANVLICRLISLYEGGRSLTKCLDPNIESYVGGGKLSNIGDNPLLVVSESTWNILGELPVWYLWVLIIFSPSSIKSSPLESACNWANTAPSTTSILPKGNRIIVGVAAGTSAVLPISMPSGSSIGQKQHTLLRQKERHHGAPQKQ